MARTVKSSKTGLLSPLPSQQYIPGDNPRVPAAVDPSKSLISPPPEETLRYGHRYSESAPDTSPQPISKRKRATAPTAPRPDAITRTQSTTSTQSLDLTPNPKPRKQSRKSIMAAKSIAAESPTRNNNTTPSRSKAILIPESPHIHNPNADFIIPSASRRRSRAPLSPVPYEPPAERFTPPREVTMSPPLRSYNRASSRSKKADGTKKKLKGVMYIKTEMPDIDLTPLPPPSPTEDPLLLSGPAKRTTRSKKKTNHARAATTNALKEFKATYDKLAAERPPRASQSNATSSSPRSPTFEFDHHAPSSSSSISPIIDQDGTTKNWTFAHVPLSSEASSFPNESIPDDIEWNPKPVPLTSFPSNASDHEAVLPTFESALAGTYDHLNHDDGWSSDEDVISEGEGEYTGHYKTIYMPTKQDPPTSVTKTRMDEWGRPKSPFPKKSTRRRGGDEMDIEEEEEEQHSDASDLLDITGEDPDADFDDVHEEDLVLADEDMHSHPPAHDDSIEEDVSMEEDDTPSDHSPEENDPADDHHEDDDDEEEENFVDRELSREPDAVDDDDIQPAEEQGEDTINVSYSLLSPAPPDNDMHGQEDTTPEDLQENHHGDESDEDVSPAHHENDMPGQEDTSPNSSLETDVLGDLDDDQEEEEGIPTITIRTPSPASNPPIDPATLLRSPSPHHIIPRVSPGPSLLSQQLAARRQSAAPSPSSRSVLRQPSPADSVVEISPPPPIPPVQNIFAGGGASQARNSPADFSPQPNFGPLPLHSLEDEEDSDGDLNEGDEDESMIKITSDNPRAAARAAAILKQYDYECYTKLTLKRLNEQQQQRSRSRSTSLDAFSRDARRRGLSDAGIRKSVSKSPRKQRQSIGGVIGEQVFIPGSPVTTLPNLLKEAEEDLLHHNAHNQPDLLSVVGGSRSQSVLDRFSTPEPRRGGSLLRRSDYDDIIANRSEGWNGTRGKGKEEWTKEDWKLLDACFTDERLATAVRMGLGEGEMAGVDDVDVGDVVRRFAEVCGIEVNEDGEGEDKVWSFAGICKRARALQRKQRSGNVAAPTGRFSMTPALSLSTAGSPPPQVPDFTPLASRPLPRRPVLPPPVVEDAPFKDLTTVPKVLLAPRYSHLLSEAIAVGNGSPASGQRVSQQRRSYEDDESAELEYVDDDDSNAGYDDSGEFDEDDAEGGEGEEEEDGEEERGTPGLGGKVKGFIFSYLPTLSKNNKNNGSKIPKPASRRGLPLPPKEVLNKPRGPVNTPARPPAPKVPAPRDLVHLNAAPLPVEKKKSSIPLRKPPQRLVELHPVTPKPSEPMFVVPTRQRKSSTGSVKDLVRSFEKMDEEGKRESLWKTGSLKELRSLKGRGRPGVVGASKPVWR